VNGEIALNPFTPGDAEFLLDVLAIEELVSEGEVVAHGRAFALFTDIVVVEGRFEGVAEDADNEQLAVLESVEPERVANHGLAHAEPSLEDTVLVEADEVVVVGVLSVLGVLVVGVNPPVSDRNALEVNLKIFGVSHEVVSHSWDIMPSIALTSDVEVLALHLRVLFEESNHKLVHVC